MANEIFSDKIRLAGTLVEKELSLINSFNSLLYNLNMGYEDIKELDESAEFFKCFTELLNIYDFLKYDYVEKLIKQEKEELENILKEYRRDKIVSLGKLERAKDLILKVMSLSKFHDVLRADKEELNIEEAF